MPGDRVLHPRSRGCVLQVGPAFPGRLSIPQLPSFEALLGETAPTPTPPRRNRAWAGLGPSLGSSAPATTAQFPWLRAGRGGATHHPLLRPLLLLHVPLALLLQLQQGLHGDALLGQPTPQRVRVLLLQELQEQLLLAALGWGQQEETSGQEAGALSLPPLPLRQALQATLAQLTSSRSSRQARPSPSF